LNGNPTVSNFSSILLSSLNSVLAEQGISLNECVLDTLVSEWYVDLKIGNQTIVNEMFYTGYGSNGYPSNLEWRQALVLYLPEMNSYGYNFTLNGNTLTVFNTTSNPAFVNQTLYLNVGINLTINCS
jgi:hypothetical protein